MLRRSAAVLLVVAALIAVAGCGIKGPLKLPHAKPGAAGTPPAPPPVLQGDQTPDRSVPDTQPEGGK